jgi:hypothetical protein
VGPVWRDTSEAERLLACLPACLPACLRAFFLFPARQLCCTASYSTCTSQTARRIRFTAVCVFRWRLGNKGEKDLKGLWSRRLQLRLRLRKRTLLRNTKTKVLRGTLCNTGKRRDNLARYVMASRLAFMDLSVDLKTLIVQHVSLWVDGFRVAREAWG